MILKRYHALSCLQILCPYIHPGEGSKGQIFLFSESSHFAYQINGNEAWISIQPTMNIDVL